MVHGGVMDPGSFRSKFKDLAVLIDSWLESECQCFEPRTALNEALCYSLLSAGKRIRPVLVLACAEMLGLASTKLRNFALAVEYIHTASLVHDDLPALDDDSLRRGRPTCHKRFGEAIALLAGDALIAKAFFLITSDEQLEARDRIGLAGLLSSATYDLCVGQEMDLEQNSAQCKESPFSESELAERHLKKTGALISAALEGPSLLLGDNGTQVAEILRQFGLKLGLLFQITDDILDATVPTEVLGKDAASDSAQGTITYVSMHSVDGARAIAEQTADEARACLDCFGDKAEFLKELVRFVLTRER